MTDNVITNLLGRVDILTVKARVGDLVVPALDSLISLYGGLVHLGRAALPGSVLTNPRPIQLIIHLIVALCAVEKKKYF